MNLATKPFQVLFPVPRDLESDPVRVTFDRGGVHYVTSVDAFKHESPRSMLVTGRVIGSPDCQFHAKGRSAGEGLEPNFRPFLIAGMGVSSRWWPNQFVYLSHRGEFELRISLQQDNWTDALGKHPLFSDKRLAGWQKTLRKSRVGFTFGGGNSFGHGVFLSRGWCTVEIDTFRVD